MSAHSCPSQVPHWGGLVHSPTGSSLGRWHDQQASAPQSRDPPGHSTVILQIANLLNKRQVDTHPKVCEVPEDGAAARRCSHPRLSLQVGLGPAHTWSHSLDGSVLFFKWPSINPATVQ